MYKGLLLLVRVCSLPAPPVLDPPDLCHQEQQLVQHPQVGTPAQHLEGATARDIQCEDTIEGAETAGAEADEAVDRAADDEELQ